MNFGWDPTALCGLVLRCSQSLLFIEFNFLPVAFFPSCGIVASFFLETKKNYKWIKHCNFSELQSGLHLLDMLRGSWATFILGPLTVLDDANQIRRATLNPSLDPSSDAAKYLEESHPILLRLSQRLFAEKKQFRQCRLRQKQTTVTQPK